MMRVRPFEPRDEAAVIELWRRCELLRPQNDPKKDIARKLKVQRELFLVGEIDGNVVASVMAGYDGHRCWVNYLAVNPRQQRRGLGRQIMAEVERLMRERGCAKINLQVRTTNPGVIEFYKRIGFAIDDVVSLGKRLEKD